MNSDTQSSEGKYSESRKRSSAIAVLPASIRTCVGHNSHTGSSGGMSGSVVPPCVCDDEDDTTRDMVVYNDKPTGKLNIIHSVSVNIIIHYGKCTLHFG